MATLAAPLHVHEQVSPLGVPEPRRKKTPRVARDLSPEERRVHMWVRQHHGVLSEIARKTQKSVQFVQRVAYNREARSRGLVVEKMLLKRGCPLIQKVA